MMELLDLDNLTEEERTIILNVIRRDDELRRRQENRISQVKQELHNLRMNSVLRQGDDLSKICARCKAPFGFITNTGEVCPVCRFRVCRNCRENLLTHGWMCILCFKENQLRWLSGDWMVKDKGKNHKPFSNGTDLVRASLRIKRSSGSLGGLEERAGHNTNANRAAGAPGPASQLSPDTNNKRLSTLFDSIRLGLGGGGGGGSDDAAAELPTVGAVGGVGGPGCGGMVVQHVSCRRRRDSNSSSSSSSDSDWQGAGKRRVYSEMNGAALRPSGPQGTGPGRYYGARSDTESAGRCSAGSGSAEREPRVGSLSQSLSSGASASTVRERERERDAEGVKAGWGGEDASRAPVVATAARPTGRTPQREAGRKSEGRQRKDAVAAGPFQRQSTLDGDRPSSGCSFTSSEWGEMTPTESAPSLATQPAQDRDRKEEAGSALGHSSGYVSASRRSFDVGDSSLNNNNNNPPLLDHDVPAAAPKCRTLPSRPSRLSARSRQDSKDSSSLDAPHHPDTPPPPPPPHHARNNSTTRAAQGLVRRQSSGRSETLSTCSAKTASPATKMRLLDLASNRALERDGDDSLKSWSAGSEDTMSLGMSCSGLQAAPDAPMFQKVHYKRPKGSRETDVQHVPRLNQPRQSDADRTGSSDQSDADPTSPAKRSNSPRAGTPQRSSHLSIPATVASSHTGSIDEKSLAEDDNIDELFAKHQMGSRLGYSRSSISDSRESLASVYSDAGEINYGRIPVSGEITFGLEYDHKLSVLKIHIKGCRDLAPVDTKHNRSDPYVKVYLLPDKTRSGKRKSKIKKHTLNPVYNETLTYNISQGELENRTLWVTVWHSDRFGRNDFLGEVTIPMDLYRFGDTTPRTYTLQSRMPDTMNESAMQYKGDLIISLMYVTPDQAGGGKKSKSKSKKSKAAAEALGEIHCLVKAANNLTAVRSNGTSDPFVKGYLLPDRGRTGKQKTPVVKNSVNPTWNHNLVFDSVDAMELADRSLELTVWDHEKLGTNEFLGGVRLNLGLGVVKEGLHVDWMDARGEESMAWQSMMEQPNTWIDAKLPLRASMGKASAKK